MQEIIIGTTGKAETKATEDKLASSVGSGSLRVFATPEMIALMEQAACNALADKLEGDETTVGTELNVKHVSATPEGMNVCAEAEVIAVNGREFTFTVKAYDDAGLIGEGEHKRFLVFGDKFIAKANTKKA